MSVIQHLAASLNQKSQEDNLRLANRIAKSGTATDIKELIEHLTDKNKSIRHDCIKVLYEIGAVHPDLIKAHYLTFIQLLKGNDNRMQWGAMTALNTIASEVPTQLYKAIPALAAAAEVGSVITRDNYIGILQKLYTLKLYNEKIFPLMMEQFTGCPLNQLPMYAENIFSVINEQHKAPLIKILTARLDEFEKETKRKRIEKVIKKLQAK